MRGFHASTRATQARAELGSLPQRIAALGSMTMRELRDAWAETFGYATESRNHAYMRKKIAWRLQEIAEGGLSARARERIAELAPNAPIRHRVPAHAALETKPTRARDPRLPPAGAVLRRAYGGIEHEVVVHQETFAYGGRAYASLSAIAKAITGTPWNGLVFFGLAQRSPRKAAG
jgi:hypothetical protein